MDKISASEMRSAIADTTWQNQIVSAVKEFDRNRYIRLEIGLPFGMVRSSKAVLAPVGPCSISDAVNKNVELMRFIVEYIPGTRYRAAYSQKILAPPSELKIKQTTGFWYKKLANTYLVKKFFIPKQELFEPMMVEMIKECNKVYLLYCDC